VNSGKQFDELIESDSTCKKLLESELWPI